MGRASLVKSARTVRRPYEILRSKKFTSIYIGTFGGTAFLSTDLDGPKIDLRGRGLNVATENRP